MSSKPCALLPCFPAKLRADESKMRAQYADTLDALPPTLTRSLSDIKELDAVLSGACAHDAASKLCPLQS